MTPARRLTLAAASLATSAALMLTGCASQEAGSAATFTDSRIAETALSSEVAMILEAKGQSPTTEDASLVQQTLGRMITTFLVDRLSTDQGIVISQGMIDGMTVNYEAQLGGAEALEAAFLQENVAPEQIETLLVLQLQAQELGYVLNPSGSAEEQGLAAFEAISALSQELETTVSPRFGTWDPQTLSIAGIPNDLSTPPVAE